MKITISPTKDQSQNPPKEQQPTLSLEIPSDDLDFEDMIECLIIPLLEGMGYHQDTINQYFGS